ncbi:MAG: tetrahydromethanopterin S-methyltransferase subunit C [Methanomicrobiales archaeon]|nr:tetrahydromethanopterin S-methyltransferase subunit C [Methanomicrobiales archaeon]MDI6875915.1 tetrahydromethanopterin S-methyltransferase subunit C [Methanomicrobiales archaeon]
MTVKVEVKEGGMPHNQILATGLIGSLVGIYITYLNNILGTDLLAFFGGIAATLALYWGSHTIKRLASYGIGTGVPSAGMIAFGSGVIGFLFATRFAIGGGILVPIIAVIAAAVIGAVAGVMANTILKMHIPVMVSALIEMSIVGALTLMGLSALVTGSFTFDALVTSRISFFGMELTTYESSLIGGSIIAVLFLLGGIAIQHPFNACLGPSWEQDRMLMLALECGFLSMIPAAVISFAFISMAAATISFVVAIVGWFYTYYRYIELARRDAAFWLDAKPIKEPEAGH